MRQVYVGKASMVGALVAVLCSAISGGAVHQMNRDKVVMAIPNPQHLAGACKIVTTVYEHSPRVPIMLHPEIFRPGQIHWNPGARNAFYYMIRAPKPNDG